MNRASVLFVLLALLTAPIAVAAQYEDDYPRGGGNQGGGIEIGGGMDDGGMGDIMIGGGDMQSDDMLPSSEDVSIVDFSFQPASLFVGTGDTVEWSNVGGVAHTVDDNAGAFASGTIAPGGGFSATFDQSGVYSYHCDFHPNMRGTVVVN